MLSYYYKQNFMKRLNFMSDINFNIGQNLKKIRKDLNLKQYEIAGEDVTRNLISLMENGKTPIYQNVASIISKNINKILVQKGQDIYIQAEDILNPDRYESRKKANLYIKKLNEHLNKQHYEIELEELNEIENFLNKWNFIDKKVKIYELLGDIYYKAKDQIREYYYYIKALEVSYEYPNMKERYKLILKVVYNCIVTKKYNEAIRLCEFTLSTQKSIPEKYKGIFHYNCALAYFYLDDYSKSLDHIIYAKFYVPCNSYRETKRILILEGICNFRIKNYDGSLRTYNKLLNILENIPEEICLTYVNIIQIYIEKNNKEKVTEYHNKTLDILPDIDNNSLYLPGILLSIAQTYYYFKDYDLYDNYLSKSIDLANKQNNKTLFWEILLYQLDLYTETDKPDKIDSILKKYESEIYDIDINESFSAILKIIYSFIRQDKNWESKYFIKSLLEKEGSKNED